MANDDLAAGFAWGREGPLSNELLDRIAASPGAALVRFEGHLHEHAAAVAKVGRALRDAGGLAVRMEACGGASPWETWLPRLESGNLQRLYEAAVILVADDDDVVFTCGMHHFDLPDAQVKLHRAVDATAWLDSFCLYQLLEQPALRSGHTFQPDAEAARRTFERWPDHRHHPHDGRHNPFGVWRFLEPGEQGIQAGALALTPIPSLVALLRAAEDAAQRALERTEVEKLAQECACVAMTARDASALERSRGYADIEPERAWEQWKLLRAMLGDAKD